MYIGYIFNKPCEDVTYAKIAIWCNENNAHIEDKNTYYKVVENPQLTFKELLDMKRVDVWSAGDAILAAIKANYTEAEIESWSKQEQGANDIKAGNIETSAALFVVSIAQNRGIETSVLVDKILNNVAMYGALSAKVIGEQQRLDDLIKVAEANQDKEALEAIVWTYNPFEQMN